MPISNPTQSGADKAAKFLTATDEATALGELASDRVEYVIVDWELPFRDGADGSLAGRFQNLADWAGMPTVALLLAVLLADRPRSIRGSRPGSIASRITRSMAYRLMVLGGEATQPVNNTYVVQIRERTDLITAASFCEVVNRWPFANPEAAKLSAVRSGAPDSRRSASRHGSRRSPCPRSPA